MCKTQEEFLENFARLGVFSKVQALTDNNEENNLKQFKTSSQDLPSTQRSQTLCIPLRSTSSGNFTILFKFYSIIIMNNLSIS